MYMVICRSVQACKSLTALTASFFRLFCSTGLEKFKQLVKLSSEPKSSVYATQWCSPRGNCLVSRRLEAVFFAASSSPGPRAFCLMPCLVLDAGSSNLPRNENFDVDSWQNLSHWKLSEQLNCHSLWTKKYIKSTSWSWTELMCRSYHSYFMYTVH